ncbi:hypothetical protein MPSEU_000551300 [Mayamaea pseudoterrestris]|nr:hypothetical protein MPSEU_000551300 [Mayamaea pseudoterrestris]
MLSAARMAILSWLVTIIFLSFTRWYHGETSSPVTTLPNHVADAEHHYHVIIYRATPAGIAAAIAAKQTSSTARVLILEPTARIGGMATEGGIGLRDAFTNDFRYANENSSQYQWGRLNAKHYGIKSLVWQRDNWVGEQSFWILLEQAGVEVKLNSNFIEGSAGVVLERNSDDSYRIQALLLQNNAITILSADYFIDASYEGELMQATRVVDWTHGRESRAKYNEPFAGVGNFSAAQFPGNVNPFLPNGSLLKYLTFGDNPNLRLGQADDNLMAYSYRVCLTKDPLMAVPVTPPLNYNPDDFELARRLIRLELSLNRTLSQPWLYMDYTGYDARNQTFVKYDACCGQGAFGIDAVGLAKGYVNATRAARATMAHQHLYYTQGLLWFWRTDPVVPAQVRRQHQEYGLCGDEWIDHGHYPRQMYVREAARLVGDQVFTQRDRTPICRPDSIAVGAWGLDQHDMQRVTYFDGEQWIVMNEGLRGDAMQQGGVFPFEIPCWIILPKRKQMTNLAVVNCPSASHVTFSAIRLEPTLWLLGQAAGAAAMLASTLELGSLHNVNFGLLQRTLKRQGSRIHIRNISVCERSSMDHLSTGY